MPDGDEERPEPPPLTRVELELPDGRYLMTRPEGTAELLRRARWGAERGGPRTRLPH